MIWRPQEENLRKAAKKPAFLAPEVSARRKCASTCIHPLFPPFPPSQAPLNNEWKLSMCIYDVPHHGPVNSTWQFSDKGMIWTGMGRYSASQFRKQC